MTNQIRNPNDEARNGCAPAFGHLGIGHSDLIRISNLAIRIFAAAVILCLLAAPGCNRRSTVVVGSKIFTESVILGDIATQTAQRNGAAVSHRKEINGTRLVWNALLRGDIDVYPEYTGTISNEIFAGQNVYGDTGIRRALAGFGVEMTRSLGFSDNYALGMRGEVADRLAIHTISDLRQHSELRFGFSNEFLDRADGWPSLRQVYQLAPARITGLDHELAYRALNDGKIDVTDLYSTDAEIAQYHFRILADDLHHFPDYQAVYLYRSDLNRRAPEAVRALRSLEGRIGAERMIQMNAEVKIGHVPESRVAAEFLHDAAGGPALSTFRQRLASRTWQHVELVGVSLLAAIIVAIPLGVLAASFPQTGQVILGVVAAIYTIPSLALLAFMLPLLGIGWKPVVVALFLYSLLPIVRNTYSGLRALPAAVRESAEALGLPPLARLVLVELPLISPALLAGIQTSAVLNIGTATVGALIGAGGYGQPILTGIRLDDKLLILEGAVPAALMALLVQGGFELLGRYGIPRGLRARHDA